MTRTHPFFFFRDPFIYLNFKTTFQFKLILGLKMLKKYYKVFLYIPHSASTYVKVSHHHYNYQE